MKYGSMGNDSHLYEICAVCGGRRGLHNHMNQRCPVDINASGDHTEYRDTVFKSIQPPSLSGANVLVDKLRQKNPFDHRNEDQAKFYQCDGWDAACNAMQSLLKADDLEVDYIDTEGKCPNCGVEFRIHKQSPQTPIDSGAEKHYNEGEVYILINKAIMWFKDCKDERETLIGWWEKNKHQSQPGSLRGGLEPINFLELARKEGLQWSELNSKWFIKGTFEYRTEAQLYELFKQEAQSPEHKSDREPDGEG